MQLGPTTIADTFAEAFRLRYARLLVTAHDDHWVTAAAAAVCGYGTSVIGCDAEIGVERQLAADESPDGRPGVSILAFGFAAESLAKAVANRVGQCLLTCPTTAVFDGLPDSDERFPLGKQIRFFGDGSVVARHEMEFEFPCCQLLPQDPRILWMVVRFGTEEGDVPGIRFRTVRILCTPVDVLDLRQTACRRIAEQTTKPQLVNQSKAIPNMPEKGERQLSSSVKVANTSGVVPGVARQAGRCGWVHQHKQ